MSRLLAAVEELLARATTSGNLKEVEQAAMDVQKSMDRASAEERNESLRKLASRFEELHPLPAASVAITCGALVERGGDPLIAGAVMLPRLEQTLEGAAEFHQLCEIKASADGTLGAGEDEEDAPPADELAQKYFQSVYEENPDAAFAYMGEQQLSLAVIAHLSRSKALRQTARGRQGLLERSWELDRAYHGGHSFLTKMLMVLDEEPLLVLDTDQNKGYRGTISGIPDNFTLHTLLMGRLFGDPRQGWIEATGIELDPIRYAMTHSCDQNGPVLTGAFNLWNWTGLQSDGTLPAANLEATHWIWNEGVPADIRPFEGLRIVVLGQPAYSRSWRGGLVFAGMIPEFDIREKLAESAVREWFRKLGAAPKPAAQEG